MAIYGIGQLAKLTGCKITTIRYYEEASIIPVAQRSEGNQRRYNDEHLQCLRFVRHCRSLGFNLEEVRQLIHLQDCNKHSPDEAHVIAKKHLQDVLQKINQLQLLANELQEVVKCCSEGEAQGCQTLSILNSHVDLNDSVTVVK
ncbi:MerR family transcriptional regulator [Psychromonas marina]|uniref:MerR family transcriptional regulator n=1 Tax=Psychromonas marina TaxID=88364 RepID=A0ABQ6DXI3_9GAMM|nr:helix-turn-helix domain-containing protein [Psychromonas marina]GLS89861.1 MerR family transcriptional regulator [Psychromonas marina]